MRRIHYAARNREALAGIASEVDALIKEHGYPCDCDLLMYLDADGLCICELSADDAEALADASCSVRERLVIFARHGYWPEASCSSGSC